MVSRNDPCHCGSGKKFKKCCLNKTQVHAINGFHAGDLVSVQKLGDVLDAKDYVGLLDLGILYKRSGRYIQAKEAYIDAIKLEPKRSMAYYNLGKILYILGEYEASEKSYRTALELGHKKLEPMRHLGYSLLAQNIELKDAHIEKHYLQSIDPAKRYTYKKPSNEEIADYESRCAEAATAYLDTLAKA